eukprot:g2122.t1
MAVLLFFTWEAASLIAIEGKSYFGHISTMWDLVFLLLAWFFKAILN